MFLCVSVMQCFHNAVLHDCGDAVVKRCSAVVIHCCSATVLHCWGDAMTYWNSASLLRWCSVAVMQWFISLVLQCCSIGSLHCYIRAGHAPWTQTVATCTPILALPKWYLSQCVTLTVRGNWQPLNTAVCLVLWRRVAAVTLNTRCQIVTQLPKVRRRMGRQYRIPAQLRVPSDQTAWLKEMRVRLLFWEIARFGAESNQWLKTWCLSPPSHNICHC